MSSTNRLVSKQGLNMSLAAERQPTAGWAIPHFAWALFFVAGFGIGASLLTTDGTPDFKIYHYYNGFAAHHVRLALDIFPAQLQTAFFPGTDYIYYWLFTTLNNHPILLNVALSIPYSIAAFVVFQIALLFAGAGFFGRDVICALAAVVGLTGASALPTLATTMTDIVPGLPLLISLWIWLALEKAGRNTILSSAFVGLLAGVSVGLKLTEAPLFIGVFLAIVFRRFLGNSASIWEAVVFGCTGIIAFAAVDANWLLGNYLRYGNPVFPLMNDIFKSNLVASSPWTDLRFMPKTPMMAMLYPAYWAFWRSHDAIELNMRDPRIFLGCLSALAIVAIHTTGWLKRPKLPLHSGEYISLYLAIAYLVSFILWEKLWSIYRYLAIQEALSGTLVLAALILLFGKRMKSVWMAGIFVASCGGGNGDD